MSKIKRITSWLIVASLALSAVFALVACKKDVIDNEKHTFGIVHGGIGRRFLTPSILHRAQTAVL